MDKRRLFSVWMRALCAASLTCAATLISAGSVDAATTVVTPGNMDGWTFQKTDTSATYGAGDAVTEMVNGPGTPPLGTGSAHFNTGTDGFQSAQLRNSDWAGTRIDALTSLGYSTYATAWNSQQVPYLTIYLDTTGDGLLDDRLWFEPDYSSAGAGNGNPSPQPDTALDTWQTWDALNGMWYSDNHAGPGSNAITLAAYLLLEPNATIINDAAHGIGGIRIASGFSSSTDTFDANVDAFSIGTAAGTTTYNFELNEPAAVAEPDTATFALLLSLGLVAVGWRRGKQA